MPPVRQPARLAVVLCFKKNFKKCIFGIVYLIHDPFKHHDPYNESYQIRPISQMIPLSRDNVCQKKLVEQTKSDRGTSIRLSISDVLVGKMECSTHLLSNLPVVHIQSVFFWNLIRENKLV